MSQCDQEGCKESPTHRFTWPSRDEARICAMHLPQLREVARVLGMRLQVIPLSPTPETDQR